MPTKSFRGLICQKQCRPPADAPIFDLTSVLCFNKLRRLSESMAMAYSPTTGTEAQARGSQAVRVTFGDAVFVTCVPAGIPKKAQQQPCADDADAARGRQWALHFRSPPDPHLAASGRSALAPREEACAGSPGPAACECGASDQFGIGALYC